MLGLSIPEVAERSRIGMDPAAAALIARMTVSPDAARAALIDATVRALGAAGLWAKLDLLYVLAAHDAQAARRNWIQDAYNLAAVNTPGFTVDRGYAGDGATSYLDTGHVPSAQGLPLNSAAIGIWCRATGTGTQSAIGSRNGTGSNPGFYLNPRNSSGQVAGRVNCGVSAAIAGASGAGLSALDRGSSSLTTAYFNGAAIGTDTAASSSVPTSAVAICGVNTAGTVTIFDNRQHAAAFVAKVSLSAAEHLALYNALAAYMTAVGA